MAPSDFSALIRQSAVNDIGAGVAIATTRLRSRSPTVRRHFGCAGAGGHDAGSGDLERRR